MFYRAQLLEGWLPLTAVTTKTRPQGFFFGSNLRFGGRHSTVTMVFTRWPTNILSPFLEHSRRKMSAFNPFYIILLQDLTPLHVKITRSTNLLSFCRRKIKLSTYLHPVSYNHISFLNTHSQLVWALAGSGFYSITWIMLSRSAGYKIHFRKQPSSWGNFFLLSVSCLSFLWIYAPWQFVHGSLVFIQSKK